MAWPGCWMKQTGAKRTWGPRLHPPGSSSSLACIFGFLWLSPATQLCSIPLWKIWALKSQEAVQFSGSPQAGQSSQALSTGRSASYTHTHAHTHTHTHKTSRCHQKGGVPSPHYLLSRPPPHLWCPTLGQAGWRHRGNLSPLNCTGVFVLNQLTMYGWVYFWVFSVLFCWSVCLPLNRVLIAVAV